MAEHLEDYQFRYRGFIWGAGTNYGVEEVEGLSSLSVRSGTKEFPRGHGAIPGKHYAESLPISFAVSIDYADSFEDIEDKLGVAIEESWTVREDFDPNMDRLEYKLPGQIIKMKYVRLMVRPIIRSTPLSQQKFRIVFENADPREYSADSQIATVPIYTAGGGGMDYPKDFPGDYPGGGTGEITVVNLGNSNAYPVVSFYGPTSGPGSTAVRLDNITNGDYVHIVTALGTGQILTADMEAVVIAIDRLPVHISGASRYGDWQLPRNPLRLSPGDNTLRFTGSGNTAGMQAVVTWRHTWL